MLPKESYSQLANPVFEAELALRTAVKEAAFFLPHLTYRYEIAGPRRWSWVDYFRTCREGVAWRSGWRRPPAIAGRAGAGLSAARGVKNVRFEVADFYRLPFPDGFFDVVFAHVVLMHLREPVRALMEIRRVLRPSGIVGVCDCAWGGRIHAPMTPLLERWYALTVRIRHRNGSIPSWDVITVACCSIPGLRGRRQACLFRVRAHWKKRGIMPASSKLNYRALPPNRPGGGLIDQTTVEAVSAEIDAWALRPDALYVDMYCEALGWVSDVAGSL